MGSKTGILSEDEAAPPYSEASKFETQFASFSLHGIDRIRLLHFPVEDLNGIRGVIKRDWKQGIQNEAPYNSAWEFKFRGTPWMGKGFEAVPARILMRGILAYLFQRGWILTITTDVSKKTHDKDALIFRKQPSPPPSSEWIAISFNRGDRLRLIGAPDDLIAAFELLLKDNRLLQEKFVKDEDSCEFKLQGYPWIANGKETVATRILVLKMLGTLERHGWSLYASLDQNPNNSSNKTDSWYCVRAIDWAIGDSIYHR